MHLRLAMGTASIAWVLLMVESLLAYGEQGEPEIKLEATSEQGRLVQARFSSALVSGEGNDVEPEFTSEAVVHVADRPMAGRSFWDQVEISGLGQVEYLRLQRSLDELGDGDGEPLNEDLISVRRARLQIERDWEYVGVSSTTELFSEAGARQLAFDIHVQTPGVNPVVTGRAGLFPVPFGFENYSQTDGQRFFGERTLFSSAFVPGRFDLGVGVNGHGLGVEWALAVQNGEPLESGRFAYQDPNAAKDYSGRIRTHGKIMGEILVAVAASLIYGTGFSPGTPPTKDTFEWRDLNEDGRVLVSELIPIPGSAGRQSRNFERWGLGGDFQLWAPIPHLGELFLYGELALGINLDRAVAPADPIVVGRDQRGLGFYVAAVQELGAITSVGVRFDHYEPNFDSLELWGGMTLATRQRFRTYTTAVSAKVPVSSLASARILCEYEFQSNSLGRDARGLPAQLDNDTLRLRMELQY